ncbi:MAG TPA: hypothetical protein VMF67_00355 [Rhizomicrobium sp.]|nr:hypothetical protein [Rhizomicrobium sp.]
MRTHLLAAIAGLVILGPFAAFAQEPADTPDHSAPAAQPVSADKPVNNPIVCENYYHEGTIIRRPDCRTLHQWERRRYAEQRFIEEFQLHTLGQH